MIPSIDVPIDRAAVLKNAEKLLRQGKLDQAIEEYATVVEEHTSDWTTRNTLGDLYVRAGRADRAAAEYVRIADAFKLDGFFSKASALYRKVLKIKPGDEHALLQGADIAVSQGLMLDARSGYNAVIEQRRVRGDAAGVEELQQRLIQALIAAKEIDQVRPLLFAQVDEACRRTDWTAAVALLELLLAQEPHDVPSLSKLVEVTVDGNLVDRLAIAQGRLVDAQLAAGHVADARYIAEDLVLRHPNEVTHEERLRRVLIAAGEVDIEAAISRCCSQDLLEEEVASSASPTLNVLMPAAPVVTPLRTLSTTPVAAIPTKDTGPAIPPTPERLATSDPPRAGTADRGRDTVVGQAARRTGNIEVDLSVVLEEIRKPPTAAPVPDLDDVFAQMRDEVRRQQEIDGAEQEYRQGVAHFKTGRIDDSVAALERAARTPRFRFESASLLGRIYLNRGDLGRAIDWLDRAAEAPAPSAEEHHRVLYNLSDALESAGDTVRALAVSLELQSSAGAFRDVGAKIRRLSQAQAGG